MIRTALVGLLVLAGSAAASDVVDERLALNYEIVFDTSGSMGGDKIASAKRALKQFLSLVPPEAKVGLIVFTGDGRPRRVIPLGPLDRQRIAGSVDPLDAAGNTPIKDSVLLASTSLLEQREKQQGYGVYTVVVVTDGEETVDPQGIHASIRHVLSQGIAIEVIGFDVPETYSLRNAVTKYRAANDEAELTAALAGVLGEAETYDEAAQFAAIAAAERLTTPPPGGPTPPAGGPAPPVTANSNGTGSSPALTVVGVLVVLLVIVVGVARSRGARP